jgi:tetratricopeptide (TPR) repeat protein
LRQAAELLRRVVQAEPYHAEAWQQLGSVALALADAAGAAEAFEKALRLRPGSVDLHLALGQALAALGGKAEAAGHFQEVLRLDPRQADAWAQLGWLLAEAGRLDEAVSHLHQALALKPELVAARRATLRRELRSRLQGSSLCDGARFVRGWEEVCRRLWRRWCAVPTAAWPLGAG